MTEVYNARYLLQATEHEIQRAERYGKELSVLFLDLDRFKLVNDRYGSPGGLADAPPAERWCCSQCIRQVDTLARYGGDEFTILLVDTGSRGGDGGRRAHPAHVVADTVFEGGRGPRRSA